MNVFVSSTIDDLSEYRRMVKLALDEAGSECHLSEDWVNAYTDTVAIVRERLAKSDGYFGIFAHYYGSVPPECDESITVLEFRWALALERPLPMAVFIPQVGEAADRELREAAAKLLVGRFPRDKAAQERYLQRQRQFRDEVANRRDQWRPVKTFRDREHLGRLAVAMEGVLSRALIRASESQNQTVTREATAVELGRVGRSKHLALASQALDRAVQAKQVAVALHVGGSEDDGQAEFAQALAMDVLKKRCRLLSARRPPFDHYGLEELVRWTARLLGNAELTSIEALATLIVSTSKERAVGLVIDPVDAFDGGLAAFRSRFWRPLFECLTRITPVRRPCLVLIPVSYRTVADGEPLPTAPAAASSRAELALPQLLNVTEEDVIGWLNREDVPDGGGPRHLEIAAAVTRSPEGLADGLPRRVLDRLRRRDLWLSETE